MIPSELQPDQRGLAWDDHVSVYETVFEPFSLGFAAPAIAALQLAPGQSVLDVGAGSGGAAVQLAHHGCAVTAVDVSAAMCARIAARARDAGTAIATHAIDGQALAFPDATFDAALSVFGVILFPDAISGLAEMRRVTRPGGRIAVVTWTEPETYELAALLRAATIAVRGTAPAGPLPAQLRFRERVGFLNLFTAAGLPNAEVAVHAATLRAPSARWLAERMAFAPGMAAMVAALGAEAPAVRDRFVADLEARQGHGEIRLTGKAFVGVARVPRRPA